MKITNDCIGCENCSEVCPNDAIQPAPNYQYVIDTNMCTDCGMCLEIECAGDAIKGEGIK